MAQIIGVRFKKVGKVYYFDPCGIQTEIGQHVIVETARGVEYGEVALANRDVAEGEVVKPLKKLIRVATNSDVKVVETNQKRAKEAFHICEQKIAEHKLDMKLVSVEYTFDLNKVLFYFTADGRVDFRELVKDLASVFRTRIELRQIGVRDEAKVLGGLGICGRPLCCASFLDDFQPVSINMAKQQNLSLNPTKISGTCGRLMCCLKYEQEACEEMSRVTPRGESTVQTPDGVGVVLSTSMLRGTCVVQLEDDPDTPRTYRCADCQVLQAGRKPRRTPVKPAVTAPVKPLEEQPEEQPILQPEFRDEPDLKPELESVPEEKPAPEEEKRKRSDRPRRRRRSGNHGESGKENRSEKPQHKEKAERSENSDKPEKRRERRPHRDRRSGGEKADKPEKRREPWENKPAEGEFMDAHRQPKRRNPRRRGRDPEHGKNKENKPENKTES